MPEISRIAVPVTSGGKTAETTLDLRDSSAAEQAALNRSAIGMQKKNLLKNTARTVLQNGVNFSVDSSGRITADGTTAASCTYYIFNDILSFDQDVIVSYSGTFSNMGLYARTRADADSGNQYTAVNESGLLIPAGTVISQIYLQQQTTGRTVSAENLGIMIRYAGITDDTYEPYADDLQTQINNLIERITALESGSKLISAKVENKENFLTEDEESADVLTPDIQPEEFSGEMNQNDERTNDLEQDDLSRDDESRSIRGDGQSLRRE